MIHDIVSIVPAFLELELDRTWKRMIRGRTGKRESENCILPSLLFSAGMFAEGKGATVQGGVANFYLRKVVSTPLFSHFEALSLLLLNGCTCSPVRGWMTRRLPAAFFSTSKGDDPH